MSVLPKQTIYKPNKWTQLYTLFKQQVKEKQYKEMNYSDLCIFKDINAKEHWTTINLIELEDGLYLVNLYIIGVDMFFLNNDQSFGQFLYDTTVKCLEDDNIYPYLAFADINTWTQKRLELEVK